MIDLLGMLTDNRLTGSGPNNRLRFSYSVIASLVDDCIQTLVRSNSCVEYLFLAVVIFVTIGSN